MNEQMKEKIAKYLMKEKNQKSECKLTSPCGCGKGIKEQSLSFVIM